MDFNTLPKHNGWANYPTWCVYTWLTNDEVIYANVLDILRNERDGQDKAERLKQFVECMTDEYLDWRTNVASDLVGWALEYVDWKSIVEALEE